MSSVAHRGSIRHQPPSIRGRRLARADPSAAGAMTPHPRGRLPAGTTGLERSETMPPEPWRCSDVLRHSSSHEQARLALLHGQGSPLVRPRAMGPSSGAARSWRIARSDAVAVVAVGRASVTSTSSCRTASCWHHPRSSCLSLSNRQRGLVAVYSQVIVASSGTAGCPANQSALTSTSSCRTAM
jgi:hypothetical protein